MPRRTHNRFTGPARLAQRRRSDRPIYRARSTAESSGYAGFRADRKSGTGATYGSHAAGGTAATLAGIGTPSGRCTVSAGCPRYSGANGPRAGDSARTDSPASPNFAHACGAPGTDAPGAANRIARDFRTVSPPSSAAKTSDAAETGFDAETGHVLDAEKYRRWQKRQKEIKTEAPAAGETVYEVFLRANRVLQEWVDQEANRPLLAQGLCAVRADGGVQALIASFAMWGQDFTNKLWQRLEFLVTNRLDFYASRA